MVPSLPELAKRLLLTILVVLIVIVVGHRQEVGAFATAMLALIAGFLVNFLVPRD